MGDVLPFQFSDLLFDSLLVITIVFVTGSLVSYLLIPLIIRMAPALGLVDQPRADSIHRLPIPRAGGIAIFIAFHFSVLILLLSPIRRFGVVDLWDWWHTLAITSFVIFIVGISDDRYRLSARWKLVGQLCASLIAYAADVRIETVFGYPLAEPLVLLLTVFWFLLMTNAFNLIDGVDGLAGGLAALSALGLAGSLIFRGIYIEAVTLIGLIAAILGFLHYNRYPAKVFLGDCGSNLCGFILAYIMLTTGSKNLAFAQQWIVLLAFAVPFLDTGLAVWRRAVGIALHKAKLVAPRNNIFTGDLEHIHHKLLAHGLDPRSVVSALYLISSIFILASLISLPLSNYAVSIIGGAIFLVSTVILIKVPLREIKESAILLHFLIVQPKHPWTAVTITYLLDLILLSIALIATLAVYCWECTPASGLTCVFGSVASSPFILITLTSLTVAIVSKTSQRILFVVTATIGTLIILFFFSHLLELLPGERGPSIEVSMILYVLLGILLLSAKQIALRGISTYVRRNNLA